ncbi:MAG: SDR family NAD(P)-dependent oxidoreductase, partial [Actinobacteria bacterium]|nr:SDR family NAD(P)-dependent oxidoreductase [Actinomycetota bacterium]
MKLAFVSGGSRGLGKEVAKALAKQGHRVVIIG